MLRFVPKYYILLSSADQTKSNLDLNYDYSTNL